MAIDVIVTAIIIYYYYYSFVEPVAVSIDYMHLEICNSDFSIKIFNISF